MNKKFLGFATLALIVLMAAGPVTAVPRMQSYIVGSEYFDTFGMEEDSWVAQNSPFTYRAVGYWEPWSEGDQVPDYDEMSVYVVIGVPKGQTGTITINGLVLDPYYIGENPTLTEADFVPAPGHPTDGFADEPNASLYNHEPMKDANANYYMVYLGQVNNSEVAAYHYDHGIIGEPGWGGEIDVRVTVSGFEWVHFDAVGVGVYDELTYVNAYSHDASYYVPEPGSLSLLGVGLLGMVPFLRRKRTR